MGWFEIQVVSVEGTHFEVTGAFIKDAQQDWNEIHPVTSIVIK